MKRIRSMSLIILGALCANSTNSNARAISTEAFAFFSPVISVSTQEQHRLENDEVIVKPVPSKRGQLAVFAATSLRAEPDTFLRWARAIPDLKRSQLVQAIGRFSNPPVLQDLDGLVLDQRDLDAIRRCRPGNCSLKLSVAEIGTLRRTAETESAEAVQREFRRLVLARVNVYLIGGIEALPPAADRGSPVQRPEVLADLVASSRFVSDRVPGLAAWLEGPSANNREIESFLYWSNEYFSTGKPVISVVHVGIVQTVAGSVVPEVLVAGKQVFATRYMNGALSLTALTRDGATSTSYLVYFHRSDLDVLKGFFGGLARSVVQSRLKDRAPNILREIRERIERGKPASARPTGFNSDRRGRSSNLRASVEQ